MTFRPPRPVAQWARVFLILLFAAACGALPQPFQKDGTGEDGRVDAVVERMTAALEVEPVAGVEGPLAVLLADSVAAHVQRFDVIAKVAPFRGGSFVLKGRAERETDPVVVPHVTLRWELTDRQGNVIREFVQPLDATPVEWDFGSPRVIETVGRGIGRKAAAQVVGSAAVTETSAIPSLGIFVEPVEGAPGDGEVTLTRAIALALSKRGNRISPRREGARYVLNGGFSLGEPNRGNQFVRVIWKVSEAEGGELGRATQENFVPVGTFDGEWGGTANQIAAAAVDGIHAVIERFERGEDGRLPIHQVLNVPGETADGSLPVPNATGGPVELGRISDPPFPEGTPPAPDDVPQKDGEREDLAGKEIPADLAPMPVEAVGAAPKVAEAKDPPAPDPETDKPEPAADTLPPLPPRGAPVAEGGEGVQVAEAASDSAKKSSGPQIDPPSIVFLITSVDGAPGNGNRLLELALRRVLLERDLAVTEDPRQARFRIKGDVTLAEPSGGRQKVRVDWSIAHRDGSTAGRATQEQEVLAGSLDRDWSNVALAVAAGALPGIERLLAGRVKPFADAPGDLGEPPPVPDLPQEPGRALPPPAG